MNGSRLLFIILACCLIGYYACRVEYQALKKFYPDLTFTDYLILGDKLRITPNGE